jgi:hypothetical protein
MAAQNRQIPKKKKKPRKLDAEEEVVITLGKSPKKKEDDEISIKVIKEDNEEAVVIDDDFDVEEDFDSQLEEEFEGDEPDFEEEEDDDVVVISIGNPPSKKAAVKTVEKTFEEESEEEEIQLGEPVEAEVVEEGGVEDKEGDEGKEKKREEKPQDKEPQKKKKIIAVVIVVIVILASLGIFYILQNKDPIAKLVLNPSSAMAGELIEMDGSKSSDDRGIVRMDWDFGDGGKYSEETEDAPDGRFDKKTIHSYEDTGNYNVKLTAWDGGDKKGTTEILITINELVVEVPEEKIGDSITYDVNGSVDVSNNDGLFTESSGFGTVTIKRISITYDGYMDSSIDGTKFQEDGFGESHQALERYNYQDLELEGTVSGSIDLTGTGTPTPFEYPIKDGSLVVEDRAFIDLNTYKTILSNTHSILSISAGEDLGVFSEDTLRTYSNLRVEPAVLKVEDLSPDRTFTTGQKQTKIIGEIAYTWEVEGATNLQGYPALGINIDIDERTKNNLGMVDFDMWMYIANDISFPIKTYIYARFDDDGTSTEIIYNSEIQEDGFSPGNGDIPYGTCPQSTPDGHFHRRNPSFEFVTWDSTDYVPDIGGNSTDFDFTPQMAIIDAQTSSSNFQTYLSSNSGEYVIDGYYNETQTNPLWNLTFGEIGDDTGYFVVIDNTGTIVDEDSIEISDLRNSTDDFNSVLSYSGGQLVFREDDLTNTEAFEPNGVKYYEDYRYGSEANIIYPTLSLTVSLAIERAEYGYYVIDEDGTFSAAVDAINGQMMYTWVHSGDDIMSILLGT